MTITILPPATWPLITRHALMNERFRDIIATPGIRSPGGTSLGPDHGQPEPPPGRIPRGGRGENGVDPQAGRCFVGSATREGWQLLVVVLNAPQMWEDAMALLDYGFHNYQKELLAEKGQYIC